MNDKICKNCYFCKDSECWFNPPSTIGVPVYSDHTKSPYTKEIIDFDLITKRPEVSSDDYCGRFEAIYKPPKVTVNHTKT